MKISLHALIHRFYKKKVFPKISHIQGTYRLGVKLSKVAQIGMKKVEESETEGIFEAGEWDNLIILDACRHDLYEEVEGETDFRYTLGSSSSDYMARNFSEGTYDDVVYISANPHIHESQFKNLTGRRPKDVFHTIFHTYQTDWDDNKGTVMPEDIIEDALTAEKLFPDKKKIIHFMQPHHPFLSHEYDVKTEGFPSDVTAGDAPENVWTHAERGKISSEEIWKGYRKNLEVVLESVEELQKGLGGKTVVTADHGNFVGENGLYAHPEGSKAKVLKKVPWDVIKE
ncbi:MAG: hypothetical protein BRC26_01975 [Nanohaloarchaea archaeon QH_8_44_6]|nr:MAG: hypothetical protein BRC26_01975 [Nanohaloarchaea archaeon QH_8_44_6]